MENFEKSHVNIVQWVLNILKKRCGLLICRNIIFTKRKFVFLATLFQQRVLRYKMRKGK